MIAVARVVEEILIESELALSALNAGYLNLSAYAQSIKEEVEKRAKKEVKLGTIIAALARSSSKIDTELLMPAVDIRGITLKAPLTALSYEKTEENLRRIKDFYTIEKDDFLTVTLGTAEITIIVSESMRDYVQQLFKNQPSKAIINNLSAVSIRFADKHIQEPNVIYVLLRKVAIKHINIIEIVSTYTELTFIVSSEDAHKTIGLFHLHKSI